MGDQQLLNLKFVGEVEKHEELYNYKLPGYSRKDVTEKAWQQVAVEMNMSAAECKEKWRNLRTVFTRKMKPPPSGSGAKKKAYYLETAMQFCLSFIKTLAPPSSGNLPAIPLSPTDDDVELVEENTEISCASGSMANISRPVQLSQASPTPPSSCNAPTLSQAQDNSSEQHKKDSSVQFLQCTRPKKNFTSRNKSAAADADQSVAEYFRAKKAKVQQTEGETKYQKIGRQEGLKMFLLSMLPELEELSDSQIKYFKRRVLSLIDEISTSSQDHHQLTTFSPMLSPQSDSSTIPSQNHHQIPRFQSMLLPQCNSSYISETSQETQMSHMTHATEYYSDFSQSLQHSDS